MSDFTYNHLNKYLKEKFGERTLKISINAGFTCPNRDGKCGYNGCIFCSENGSGKSTDKSISEQIKNHLNSYRGQRANKFIAYFQNFSNTYAPIDVLKEKYLEAINCDERIVQISIATRPDCINDEVVNLLFELKKTINVSVELGLQTSNDKISEVINRGYKTETFVKAVKLLSEKGIEVVVHIMVGLPFENINNILETVNLINSLDVKGVKIHSTYVVKNTQLEKMYNNGEYQTITLEKYIEVVVLIITHLRNDIIIHRISGDAEKEMLVAPSWNVHKKLVLNGVEKKLKQNNLYQGIYYKGKNDKTN